MPGETHFFEDIYARRQELGDPHDDVARARIIERLQTLYDRFREPPDQARVERLFAGAEFRAALNRARSYRDIFSAFLEAQMGAVGKRRWGNQVPRELFELDRVFAFFTDARVVACVRDPRDFLLSYRDKWQRDGSGWEADRLRKLYHPVITSLLWKSNIRTLERARQRYPGRILVSPYEALVADPEAQMRAICAFLDEEFRPEMLNVEASNSSAQTTTADGWNRQLKRTTSLLILRLIPDGWGTKRQNQTASCRCRRRRGQPAAPGRSARSPATRYRRRRRPAPAGWPVTFSTAAN